MLCGLGLEELGPRCNIRQSWIDFGNKEELHGKGLTISQAKYSNYYIENEVSEKGSPV